MFGAWESVANYNSSIKMNPRDWFFPYGLTIYFEKKSPNKLINPEHQERIHLLLDELRENIDGSFKFESNIISDRDKAHVWFSRQKDMLPLKLKYKTESFDTGLGGFIKKFRRGG